VCFQEIPAICPSLRRTPGMKSLAPYFRGSGPERLAAPGHPDTASRPRMEVDAGAPRSRPFPELFRETAEHHGHSEKTHSQHNWWGLVRPYLSARQNGISPQQQPTATSRFLRTLRPLGSLERIQDLVADRGRFSSRSRHKATRSCGLSTIRFWRAPRRRECTLPSMCRIPPLSTAIKAGPALLVTVTLSRFHNDSLN
jgi:hypothetical protein